MVEAKALIYRLQRKLDRLNTEHKKAIGIVEMCSALNEAQYFLLKDRVQKYEQDKRNRYELKPLEVKNMEIGVRQSGEISIVDLPDDLYRDLQIRVVATKRGCGTKEIPLTKLETQDIGKSLKNPFWTSSYTWEQVFGDEAADGLLIYNGADFKVDAVKIDYIKRPGEIHCPSQVIAPDRYIDWNGRVQTEDQGWLLDDLVGEGINIAALMLTRDIGDYRDFQLQLNNNIQTEQNSKF